MTIRRPDTNIVYRGYCISKPKTGLRQKSIPRPIVSLMLGVNTTSRSKGSIMKIKKEEPMAGCAGAPPTPFPAIASSRPRIPNPMGYIKDCP
jgi:hypothetical protein